MAGVKAVYLDQMEQLATDSSPEFIGVAGPGGAFESGYKGDGVVVGIIDSGIWPEHPSFADPDPFGDAYPAPPAQSQGMACEFGNTAFNADDAPFTCNNKLIGAYNFNQTYEAVVRGSSPPSSRRLVTRTATAPTPLRHLPATAACKQRFSVSTAAWSAALRHGPT